MSRIHDALKKAEKERATTKGSADAPSTGAPNYDAMRIPSASERSPRRERFGPLQPLSLARLPIIPERWKFAAGLAAGVGIGFFAAHWLESRDKSNGR
jgi:hypothetical protein